MKSFVFFFFSLTQCGVYVWYEIFLLWCFNVHPDFIKELRELNTNDDWEIFYEFFLCNIFLFFFLFLCTYKRVTIMNELMSSVTLCYRGSQLCVNELGWVSKFIKDNRPEVLLLLLCFILCMCIIHNDLLFLESGGDYYLKDYDVFRISFAVSF